MVIQADGAGNFYLGDAQYGNFDILAPTKNFLKGHPNSSISAEITALCTAAGLNFRLVLPQVEFDTNANILGKVLLAFGSSTDTIDDRFIFRYCNGGGSSLSYAAMFNNSGFTGTANNNPDSTNNIARIGQQADFTVPKSWSDSENNSAMEALPEFAPGSRSPLSWLGVANSESLTLMALQYIYSSDIQLMYVWHAGRLDNVTTDFGYYTSQIQNQSVLLARTGTGTAFRTVIVNYVQGRTGDDVRLCDFQNDGDFTTVCSDAQTPTGRWATDPAVFDDDSSLSYPTQGDLRNFVFSDGTFFTGELVTISGGTLPAGFNNWVALATNNTFDSSIDQWTATKTPLMQVYSTQ